MGYSMKMGVTKIAICILLVISLIFNVSQYKVNKSITNLYVSTYNELANTVGVCQMFIVRLKQCQDMLLTDNYCVKKKI